MRELFLFSIAIIAFNLNAQFKVKTDGTVGVGHYSSYSIDHDFSVMNVQNSSEEWAYSALRMDNVNNFLYLNRKLSSYKNVIIWLTSTAPIWYMGNNDTDDVSGSVNSLFIGKNSGGANPYMWFDNTYNRIGMFTSQPVADYELTLAGDALAYG